MPPRKTSTARAASPARSPARASSPARATRAKSPARAPARTTRAASKSRGRAVVKDEDDQPVAPKRKSTVKKVASTKSSSKKEPSTRAASKSRVTKAKETKDTKEAKPKSTTKKSTTKKADAKSPKSPAKKEPVKRRSTKSAAKKIDDEEPVPRRVTRSVSSRRAVEKDEATPQTTRDSATPTLTTTPSDVQVTSIAKDVFGSASQVPVSPLTQRLSGDSSDSDSEGSEVIDGSLPAFSRFAVSVAIASLAWVVAVAFPAIQLWPELRTKLNKCIWTSKLVSCLTARSYSTFEILFVSVVAASVAVLALATYRRAYGSSLTARQHAYLVATARGTGAAAILASYLCVRGCSKSLYVNSHLECLYIPAFAFFLAALLDIQANGPHFNILAVISLAALFPLIFPVSTASALAPHLAIACAPVFMAIFAIIFFLWRAAPGKTASKGCVFYWPQTIMQNTAAITAVSLMISTPLILAFLTGVNHIKDNTNQFVGNAISIVFMATASALMYLA